MDKNELKEARRELVNMMHLMRKEQEKRRTQIIENPGKEHSVEIDQILQIARTNNPEYYIARNLQEENEPFDKIVNDLEKMKKKKRK
jgi:hypothetical protein